MKSDSYSKLLVENCTKILQYNTFNPLQLFFRFIYDYFYELEAGSLKIDSQCSIIVVPDGRCFVLLMMVIRITCCCVFLTQSILKRHLESN